MSERPGTLADDSENDPFGGRRLTSHERMSGKPWDASYSDGPAPWDIGRPQPAIVRLASKGNSPARSSMRAAGPARTLFSSPRWDCRFWVLTWLRRHWRPPAREPRE